MSAVDSVARVFLGVHFLFFGLNGFFSWVPLPTPHRRMSNFLQALQETGYLLPFVKGLEVCIGVCLLADHFVLLAWFAAAPLVFGIVSSQLILNKGKGGTISLLTLLPFLILFLTRWSSFQPLFGG